MENNNFNQIYNEVQPMVLRYLIKLTRNKELAEDLTSEAMVKLWNNLDKFDDNMSSIKTWAISIAKNVSIDHWRKKDVDTTSMSAYVDDNGNEFFSIPVNTTPMSETLNNELGDGIKLAIEKLPMNYKKLADLYFVNQLSYQEITDEMQVPLGTVKGKINRLRSILQCSLKNFKLA